MQKTKQVGPAMKIDGYPRVTFRLQLIHCGKKHCNRLHGPYWYAFWHTGYNRTKSKYIGKRLTRKRIAKVMTLPPA